MQHKALCCCGRGKTLFCLSALIAHCGSQGTERNKYSWDLFGKELLQWSEAANLVDFPLSGQ